MRHVHLSRKLWQVIHEGRRGGNDLTDLACGHLMQLCSTCRKEFETFQLEAAQAGQAMSRAGHRLAVTESIEWAKEKAREVADERRAAEPKLAALLAMPESARLAAVKGANEDFRGLALAQLLIEASRGKLPGAPRAALGLAELAAVILTHVPWSPIGIELYARTTAHMANALRVTGQLSEASRLFHTARFLLRHEGGGDRLVQAELDHFEGALRRDQRQFAEAELLLRRSVSAYRGEALPLLAAQSLLTLCVMHLERDDGDEALQAPEQATELLAGEESQRLFFYAQHNRAYALCLIGQNRAARAVVEESQHLYARFGDQLTVLRLSWLEGKIALGLGERKAAESSLLAARHGFLKHGVAYDSALVSLELALLYLEEGRAAEVKQLADEMVSIFEEQEVYREATAALLLFRDAAELERISTPLVRQLMLYLTQADRDPTFAFQVAS